MLLRRVGWIALVAIVLLGCSVQLRTNDQRPTACEMALASGVLVRSGATGAGLLGGSGDVQPVVWPLGFSARIGVNGLELLDAAGAHVAREGDRIEASGGSNGEGAFVICPAESIRVERRID